MPCWRGACWKRSAARPKSAATAAKPWRPCGVCLPAAMRPYHLILMDVHMPVLDGPEKRLVDQIAIRCRCRPDTAVTAQNIGGIDGQRLLYEFTVAAASLRGWMTISPNPSIAGTSTACWNAGARSTAQTSPERPPSRSFNVVSRQRRHVHDIAVLGVQRTRLNRAREPYQHRPDQGGAFPVLPQILVEIEAE